MSRPRLYVFTISHYCEKVRWALEHKGIDYELITLLPGPHRSTVSKLAPSSRVPVLVDGERLIQDSTPILDYLEERYPDEPLTPRDAPEREEVLYWEQHLATELGDRVRRYVYAHAFKDARFVRFIFAQGGPWWTRSFYALMLPLVFRAVKRMYGVTPEAAREDLARLYDLFTRTDARLARGPFLVGNTFTRADVTLAALAAPLVQPAGHPVCWPAADLLPRTLIDETRALQTTRTADYIRKLYRERRNKFRAVSVESSADAVHLQAPA